MVEDVTTEEYKINKANRVKLLTDLGFDCRNLDSSVIINPSDSRAEWISVDFSTISEKCFVDRALKEASRISFIRGKNKIRTSINSLLTPEHDV